MSKQNNTYQPLFSILIANYNNGCYLQEAIDSVLAQTYPNWEIVLVDDKSSDDSFEIYKKYKEDKRFHIYFNEENKGCGYTKRRCAELAQGELCGFLDPDDKLTPDALEVMVNEHGARAECSLVLIFSGFIRGNRMLIVISLIMVFLYGSFIWGMIPSLAIPQNISWEGHLSGALIGILLAIFLRKEGPQKEVHHWEDDDDDDNDDASTGSAADEKPYWDIPTPSNDELTVQYRIKH